ncbi:LysR substrate-binding domain-containing protein [Colwellia sp. 12G3]|uniref:LysR substrate-binding domain-containing protein n=1 Tax=Colwellia sp. 12G3 TaxID=2058299 RepID=UPI000C33713E|nr:LysR substrate-binding domain-containing protein [Colwellia sp. 12G3]PKI17208.1 LysR family transcriptional regulator [Colwellia sp. 12G3]
MKHLPPLKSLQFFLVAGQSKNFKHAAEQLNVTQAAVSQQIRLLEENLQSKLFERTNKKTMLTEKGRKLLPFTQRAFDELTTGIQVVTGDPNPQILRISTVHSFCSLWLIPRLQEFQKLHPEIMVQLAPSSELVDFKQSNIDLAIRMGRGGYCDLTEKKIYDDNLIFVASPKLLIGIDKNNPEQVFRLPWIEDTSIGIQETFQDYCKSINFQYETLVPVIQTNDALPLIDSAVHERGFLLVNSSLVVEHIRAGRLVKLLNYSIKSPYSLYLVAPEQQFLWKKVKQFEGWLVPKLLKSFSDLDKH